MPGLFSIFDLGRRSMQVQQAALQVTGNNIANAATPGFHRQRVETMPSLTEITSVGALGTGVQLDTIRRVEDRFLEMSLQREIPLQSRYMARSQVMSEAELVFGEPTENGVQHRLEEFFTSWDDLASHPEDLGSRESVIRQAVALADVLRTTRGRLDERRNSLTGEIRRVVDDANRALQELQTVNRGIQAAGARGATVGDLVDRRDMLLESLGDLVGATATLDDDGTATVHMGGRVLAQAEMSAEITWSEDASESPMFGDQKLSAEDAEGRLAGLLQARDEDLRELVERLDTFAARLVDDVNRIHSEGVDGEGDVAAPFFLLEGVGSDGVSNAAFAILVNPALVDDPQKIAAGRAGTSGDNGIALDVAALRAKRDGPGALLEALIVDAGARAEEAEDLARGQSVVVDSIRAQRESVSGVSLDEEAANLLRFQRSYQASAQLISIADEMLQTVLQL